MATQTFTLDIGESYVKVADIEQKKKAFHAHAAGFTDIAFNVFSITAQEYMSKTSEVISKLVKDAGIKKTDVNIIIPDSQSYTRIFEMPLLTDKELVSAIRYQADQFIPVPIDQVNLDIHIISKDKATQKTQILLVAASHAVINHAVKIVEDAALIPMKIENETSAVLRLIMARNEARPQKDAKSAVFINFGNSSSSIYLFDMLKNVPLQAHNFAIGQQIFYKDIKANYVLSDEQIHDLITRIGFTKQQSQYNLQELLASPLNEFINEVKRFILSSKEQNSGEVTQVYVFGEGSKFIGFPEKVSEMIGLPVALFNIHPEFEKSTIADFFAEDWPLLIPAVGGCL